MWTKKTAPIENCFGSKFSIKRSWVFVSHALQRKAEFKAVRSRGIAAIAARADFWPSFVSLWPSFKLRNRSKMELSWKTAPWQVSFKVVPNVFMELQVIIKSYTSMSYYHIIQVCTGKKQRQTMVLWFSVAQHSNSEVYDHASSTCSSKCLSLSRAKNRSCKLFLTQ